MPLTRIFYRMRKAQARQFELALAQFSRLMLRAKVQFDQPKACGMVI